MGAAAVLAAFCVQLQAQEASSNGYAISASLSLLGSDTLDVPPQAQVQFSDQTGGFNNEAHVNSIDQSSPGSLLTVSTGELSAQTQFVAPAAPYGFAVVGTQATAADVGVGAVSVLGGPELLGISAKLLTSRAIVSGYCPPAPAPLAGTNTLTGIADNYVFNNGFETQNLQASGGSDGFDDNGSAGVTVEVSGVDAISVPLDPAANTTISLGTFGSLVLNEQNETGDGIGSRGMEANALHLNLSTGVLDAEVIIAHSEASLNCP